MECELREFAFFICIRVECLKGETRAMSIGKIYLRRGKDKPVRKHHPWIFSGAIERVQDAADGDTVEVFDAGGEWLARAAFNSRSQIAARVWTFDRDEAIDREFLRRRIKSALALRAGLAAPNAGATLTARERLKTRGTRIVNAESDGLPGLVVDYYAGHLVAQFLTLGIELHKTAVVEVLQEMFAPRSIYERSDVDVRKKEGLAETKGLLWGEEPPDEVEIEENTLRFRVDVRGGHKTGFYLDQSVNRQRATPYLRGSVLNAFAYTGAFGVYTAATNGAQVTNLDASAASLDLARENFELNGVSVNAEYVTADAFQKLREYRAEGRAFDAIVLDPPKFVTSQSNLDRATRGYKDLNMIALQLLNPNGFLVTFSCSGLVDARLFQQIVFGAAVDARRDAQIVEKLGQAPDHPIGLNFPEGEYLKGLILRVK